jgi:hypothetical protein
LASDNEFSLCINGELDIVGPVTKIKGYTQKGADVNDGYNILGAISGYKSDGTMKQIVIADGASESDAYTYNTTTNTWTPHHLSLTSGARAEVEYFLDGIFMVNFDDVTRWNNYTQWYTTTNVTDAPKAKYIKLYNSRIYLAYVVDSGSTYTSRVVYSDLPSGSPYTIAWNNSENFFDVESDDKDVIKGMSVNSNTLLIFKENSLYRYNTNTLDKIQNAPGTVSQRSIKELQGVTLYLHSTGIYMYDGTSKLISRKIKDIFDGISTKNLSSACAYTKGDHYYLYVGDVNNSAKGISIDKCLIDFDIAKNGFTLRSLANEPTVFFDYRDDRSAVTYDSSSLTYNSADTRYNGLMSVEKRVFFGTTNGEVYQQDIGKSFDSSDISFTLETKDYYLGYPSVYKLFQKVHIYVDGVRAITVQYKLDDGDWKTLGKIKRTQSELIFPSGSRGKRIKFRILESSSGDKFNFEGLDVFFTAEGVSD